MNQLLDFFGDAHNPYGLVKMLVPAFMAILFLQSGIDKVLDYKGNLAYFSDHFKNSPLSKTVGLLLPVLTLLEMAAGIMSAVGVIALLSGNTKWAFLGLMLSAVSLLCLFFGQRVAKDYAGAVSIAPYFGVTVLGLLLLV